jgi:hypothetical protein
MADTSTVDFDSEFDDIVDGLVATTDPPVAP